LDVFFRKTSSAVWSCLEFDLAETIRKKVNAKVQQAVEWAV
jgi:hypothetical protein